MTVAIDRQQPQHHRGGAPGGRPPGPPPARPSRQRTTAGPAGSADRVWVWPTLLAALSVLAGATALTAVIDGGDWVVPLTEVVAVIWLLGVGCRMLRSPAPITVLAQFAGLIVALTGLFATTGWAGFIPNAGVVAETGDLLSGAWAQILSTVPPAPATVELSFLICLTVGTTALIVDFLVAEARSPALVALPLLCLYSVPASIATEMLPWWSFALPAVVYAVLLAATGHVGARGRGRTTATTLVAAVLITAVGTAAAVLTADTVTGIGTEGKLPRNSTGSGGAIGLSPFASLRGDLVRDEPRDLLTVSGLPHRDYLRAMALDTWVPGDDGHWTLGTLTDDVAADGQLPDVKTLGAATYPIRISSTNLSDRFLPIYARTTSVSGLAEGWSYDERLNTVFRDGDLNPDSYTLQAAFPEPTAEELRADTVDATSPDVALESVPDEVVRRAEDITGRQSTPFDKADALRKYFTDPENGFTYSLRVPDGPTGNPLTDFLRNKQGYCEQYAGTMAVMLRAIGIPARVAVGFTSGTLNSDGDYQITTHDAHAWVEVKFVDHGWVRFDPTPLGSASGNQQGFAESSGGTGEGTQTSGTAESTAPSPDTTEVTETEVPSISVPGMEIDGGVDAGNPQSSADQPAAEGSGSFWWWSLGVVVLVALILVTPTLVRRTRQRRRLAVARSGGKGAASAAWAEVEDLLVDHGLPLQSTESTRATANRLARHSRLTEQARRRLRTLVLALEQEWYSDGRGQRHRHATELVDAVKAVAESLHRSAPLSWPDRLLPRSLRPSSRD